MPGYTMKWGQIFSKIAFLFLDTLYCIPTLYTIFIRICQSITTTLYFTVLHCTCEH
jgi:hypothetical protein